MSLYSYQSLIHRSIDGLSKIELQDQSRSDAFNICVDNVKSVVTRRRELFQDVYSDFVELCATLRFSILPVETLWHVWLPLAIQLADWRSAKNTTLIQGFLGGQGAGKTTLTAVLTLILHHLGYETASLSIDDLYLPYCDRIKLQESDPRIIHRGPPGTHDVTLGLQVIDQIKQGNFPVEVPQFDKSAWNGAGDRSSAKSITQADIVLFEGWFVGAKPIDATRFESAPAPILTECDRDFARDMNERLGEYLPLWEQLDRLIVLYVPEYSLNKQWRKEAEHKMIAQGKAGMSDAAIDEFVEYFWKALHPELFIRPLTERGADLVIEINSDHTPGKIYVPEGSRSR
jgi:D-glycerate 3-kinase